MLTSSQRERVSSPHRAGSSLPGACLNAFPLLSRARSVQRRWVATPLADRLRVVRRFRQRLAETTGFSREELTAQIIPLCDAARFLEREAETILAPQRLPARGRAFWLRDVEIETWREPWGVVLIIAPGTYRYFLPGVQTLQALVAGNAVILKPGNGGTPAARLLASLLPEGLVEVLEESPATAEAVMAAGVDKVVLTGAAETGAEVLAQLAPRLTPATLELSGEDPVFVRADADVDLVVRAVAFGRQLHGGATCMAPRRIFAARGVKLPWPVTYYDSDEEALALAADSPYALGASVFGREPGASEFARRVRAGVVVVNDMIVPTADPRLSFGGRGRSGFGLTRGAEGLREMTVLKSVVTRRSRWRPHLWPARESDADLFAAYLALAHGGTWRKRLPAVGRLVGALVRRCFESQKETTE